jgi:hypothetical protein
MGTPVLMDTPNTVLDALFGRTAAMPQATNERIRPYTQVFRKGVTVCVGDPTASLSARTPPSVPRTRNTARTSG